MLKAVLNKKLNGIELYFDEIPNEETRNALKSNDFRWNHKTKAWYTKDTETAREFLKATFNITEYQEATATTGKATKENKKELASLWERLKVENIPKHEIKDLKIITSETRAHFKNVFPELKISCTTGGNGWSRYNEIYFTLKAAPYNQEAHKEIIEAIEKYIKSWLWSYNYDNSDSMTDYFDRGFYETIHVDNFEELEPTTAQKTDIENYYKCFENWKAEQEEAEKIRIQESIREREEEKRLFQERQKLEAIQVEEINQHVQVVDLLENEKYLIKSNMLSGIGKECNINEFYDIERNDCIKHQEETALIKRELYFENETIYNNFCNMFLNDFSFFESCGGTGTYDKRVTNENFNLLNSIQRESVNWILWDCVAVYFNNQLKLVIDPEGYTYARYVFIIDSEYTKEPAPKEEQEEKEQDSFYMPEPIAKQAEKIQALNNYTMFIIDPWSLTAHMQYIKLSNYSIKPYAQYKDSLYIDYIEPGKRKTQNEIIHDGQLFLLYPDFLPQVPGDILYTQINNRLKSVNYAGGSCHDFLLNCYKYYKSIGHEPIINTMQF